MGFLLGDMLMFVTKNVTDSERHVESTRRQIGELFYSDFLIISFFFFFEKTVQQNCMKISEITGVLACSSASRLCNETGKLHKESLKAFIHNRGKEIVGWFKFRHNNRLALTFRDKILHKELAQYFHECNPQLPKEYFVACILNATKTEKSGIHKFRHLLLRYEDGFV